MGRGFWFGVYGVQGSEFSFFLSAQYLGILAMETTVGTDGS